MEKKEVKKEKKPEVKGTVTIENNKKKNNVKTIIIILAVCIIIALLVLGIIMFTKTPYYAVMKTFNSLKKGQVENAKQFVSYEDLMDSLIEGINTGEDVTELEKNCFSEFKYKINGVKVEDNKATVTVETTNKNFRNAMTKWTQTIYQRFISGSEISNEQGVNLLNQYLVDESIGTISVTKELTLNKIEDKWQLEVNNNLIDAVFPGLNEVVNSIDALTN